MSYKTLPHFPITTQAFHVVYRLYGSKPKIFYEAGEVVGETSAKKELDIELGAIEAFFEKQAFTSNILMTHDKHVNLRPNNLLLAQPEISKVVMDSWMLLHERNEAYVYCICIMANHVHAIIGCPEESEYIDIGKLMKRHKGFTARMCNRILGREGTHFWARDYFDRTIRYGQFIRIMWYVLNNPVDAGLVKDWRNWPTTWLNPTYNELFKG